MLVAELLSRFAINGERRAVIKLLHLQYSVLEVQRINSCDSLSHVTSLLWKHGSYIVTNALLKRVSQKRNLRKSHDL